MPHRKSATPRQRGFVGPYANMNRRVLQWTRAAVAMGLIALTTGPAQIASAATPEHAERIYLAPDHHDG